MATFDQISDLGNRISYPGLQPRRPRTDSRIAPSPAEAKKQLRVPATQEALKDSLFREIQPGAQRNPYAAFASISFLFLALAALVVAPLYVTVMMPKTEILTRLYLQPPAAAGSTATRIQAPAPASAVSPKTISIPNPLHKTQEAPPTAVPTTPVAPIGGVAGGIPGGAVGGIADGLLNGVIGSTRSVPLPVKTSDPMPVKRVRVPARIAEANLIAEVPPKYPPEAGQARIEGTVVLVAVIGKDGSVEDVRVESGLPILAQAAINAVKQWRYRPYTINGEPVEVDSRITINFNLAKG